MEPARLLIWDFGALVAMSWAGRLEHLRSSGAAVGIVVVAVIGLSLVEPSFDWAMPKNERVRPTVSIPLTLRITTTCRGMMVITADSLFNDDICQRAQLKQNSSCARLHPLLG